MKHHRHIGGHRRDFTRSPDQREPRIGGHRHRQPRGGGRGGRMFDYGELRLLVLALIAEQPRHGYELIKAIEERLGGSYTPSPGVIYPTLSWLDDMGYVSLDIQQGGRKCYSISTEGEAFLAANRAACDELLSRAGQGAGGGRRHMSPVLLRAMENLKLALRLRFRSGPIDEESAREIAAALDAVVQTVERSR